MIHHVISFLIIFTIFAIKCFIYALFLLVNRGKPIQKHNQLWVKESRGKLHSSNKIHQIYKLFFVLFEEVSKGFVYLQSTNYNSIFLYDTSKETQQYQLY
jgi:hypothetical protein